MKHNNQLPNAHFRKHWARRVTTWFDQAGAKKRRRSARVAKAARIAPRPVDGLLRPAVRCPTLKYNIKLRAGRGFTFEELKAAGVARKMARSIGVSVDHRRRNKSVESLELNKARLRTYLSKLILFPKKAKAPKKGDSSATEIAAATQLTGQLLPIKTPSTLEKARPISEAEKDSHAYATLRKEWKKVRYHGRRAKRAAKRAEAAATDAKKASK